MLDPEGRRELIETVKGIRKDYDNDSHFHYT